MSRITQLAHGSLEGLKQRVRRHRANIAVDIDDASRLLQKMESDPQCDAADRLAIGQLREELARIAKENGL